MIHGDGGDVARGKFTVCELENGWSDGPFRLISCRNRKHILLCLPNLKKTYFLSFKLMPGGRFQQPLLKLAWTHRDIIFSYLKKDLNWRHMMETISHEITCFPSWMILKGAFLDPMGDKHSFPEKMFPLNQSIDAMKESEPLSLASPVWPYVSWGQRKTTCLCPVWPEGSEGPRGWTPDQRILLFGVLEQLWCLNALERFTR